LKILKYWPNSRDFNKLIIKAKMLSNTYFLNFCCMKIWYEFFFWDTWPYAWKQNILFYYYLNVLTKTGYFNTGFISLQYKNKNQYWSKWSKKFAENHRFFEKNFFEFFFYFRAGSNPAHVAGLDPCHLVTGPSQWPNQAMHA
jgi:hypothetical protein